MPKVLFRVKPKAAWKCMPDGILGDFVSVDEELEGGVDGDVVKTSKVKFPDGFDGIDELTDYDLIGLPGGDHDEDGDREGSPIEPDDSPDDHGDWEQKPRRLKRNKRLLSDVHHEDDDQKTEERTPKKQKKTLEFSMDPTLNNKIKKSKKGPSKIKAKDKRPAYDSMVCAGDSITLAQTRGISFNSIECDMSAWDELYIPDAVLKALTDLCYTHPTEIQALTIPSAIRDRMDILGAAETGSGKTLAFGIPIITHILSDKEKESTSTEDGKQQSTVRNSKLRCLIVTPTRELAIQVKNHLVAVAKYTDIKITVIVGGMSQDKQLRILKRCPEIVVGTPGRLWELIHEGKNHLAKATSINYLVIDEGDRMLEKGHFEELSRLLAHINFDGVKKEARQTFVFSATLTLIHDTPKRIITNKKKQKLTEKVKLEKLMTAIGVKDKPKIVDITRKLGTTETLHEGRISCKMDEKDTYLYYILIQHPGRTLIFCNSVDCVRRLTAVMTLLRRTPWPLHANMHQKQRLKNLERFIASDNGVLIATDVAQRGLDVPNVEHVIHYQVPRTSEAYVHRSGRTARASKEGVSIMLIDPDESVNYQRICRTLQRESDLPVFPVKASILKEVKMRVKLAQKLDQMEHRHKRLSSQNNWFTKAAKDMDIELDEDNLLHNMGNKSEQAEYRRQVTSMQQQLDNLLRKPILGERVVSRYPSGFGIDLDNVLKQATVSGKNNAISIMKNEKNEQKSLLSKLGSNFKRSKVNKSKEKQRTKKAPKH